MNTTTEVTDHVARKRSIKRNALLLGLLAAAFYIGFIVLTFARAH